MLGYDTWYLLLVIPAILTALMVHEVAHGFAAYLLGDDTAKRQGRLSFNPLYHIDPIGFLCLLVAGFGWAKPVQVNTANFKNRQVGMAVTALAGPLSNFVLAFVCLIISQVMLAFAFDSQVVGFIAYFFMTTASISVGLGIFNLIPVPPLDGSNIIFPFLPQKIRAFMYHNGQVIQFAMLALLFLNVLDPVLITGRSWMLSMLGVAADSLIGLFL